MGVTTKGFPYSGIRILRVTKPTLKALDPRTSYGGSKHNMENRMRILS